MINLQPPKNDGDHIEWKQANYSLLMIFVIIFVPISDFYYLGLPQTSFEWITWILGTICFFLGSLLCVLLQFMVIRDYQPPNALASKRANEQIKLTANLLNGIALGVIGVFALANIVRSSYFSPLWILGALLIASLLHMSARSLLGQLKDETINDIVNDES